MSCLISKYTHIHTTIQKLYILKGTVTLKNPTLL